jgi:hypothetical protein
MANKEQLLYKIGTYIIDRLRNLAPKDTLNLAFNSIILVMTAKNEIKISVSLKQASYMPYTNEPWLADKWNGKKNPNEQWWNDAIVLILQELEQMTGGKLTNA